MTTGCRCRELERLDGDAGRSYLDEHLCVVEGIGDSWANVWRCPDTALTWLRFFPWAGHHGGGPEFLWKLPEDHLMNPAQRDCIVYRAEARMPPPGLGECDYHHRGRPLTTEERFMIMRLLAEYREVGSMEMVAQVPQLRAVEEDPLAMRRYVMCVRGPAIDGVPSPLPVVGWVRDHPMGESVGEIRIQAPGGRVGIVEYRRYAGDCPTEYPSLELIDFQRDA